MLRFKRYADSLKYNGPVAAMTDNTKLKECLSYSAILGCIIGSTLPISETKVSNYEEVITIIDKIKAENAIAKQVRAYLLQVFIFISILMMFKFKYNNLLKNFRFHYQKFHQL